MSQSEDSDYMPIEEELSSDVRQPTPSPGPQFKWTSEQRMFVDECTARFQVVLAVDAKEWEDRQFDFLLKKWPRINKRQAKEVCFDSR